MQQVSLGISSSIRGRQTLVFGPIDQQTRGLDIGGHIGKRGLEHLKISEMLTSKGR